MKAIEYKTFGAPEVLEINEIEKPLPNENEVLIEIKASTVSAADSAVRSGEQFLARLSNGLFKPKIKVLGAEFAGVVSEIGKNVRKFKIGDEVYAASGIKAGAHAEYICLPETGAIAIKPVNVSFSEAAGLAESVLTALPFLRDIGAIKKGHKVLINGAAGGVGVTAVQFAKYFGAEVTAVCSGKNFDLVKALGADFVIDYAQSDFTKSSNKYDIIFDAVGKSSYPKCSSILSRDGIYLTTVPNLCILMQMLIFSNFRNKKAKFAATGLRSDSKKTDDLIFLKNLVEEEKIKPVIEKEFLFREIKDAYIHVETGHKRGSVIIKFEDI